MNIRRQGGGVDTAGRRFIRYHIHFQTKAFARSFAQYTRVSVAHVTPGGRPYVQKNGTLEKVIRGEYRRDYAHTTVRVLPGSTIRFRGYTKFSGTGIPLPGNSVLTGEAFPSSCDAR